MYSLIGSAIFAASCVVVFLCFKWLDKRLLLAFGVAFAFYIGLDDIITGLPSLVRASDILGGRWNWSGKVFSLTLSVAVILAFGLSRHALGLTLKQQNLGRSLLALVALTSLSFGIGMLFKPELPDLETVLFQATMPGLAEELAYRGIAPAILLGLFRGKAMPSGIPWTVVLITGIGFGLWHGISYNASGLSFDYMSALFPMIGGLAYGWLRFYSGSLLLPIIAHGVGNNVFYLGGML